MYAFRKAVLALLVILATILPGVAQAKIEDGAGLFSAGAVSQAEQKIAALKSAYNRDVLVVTVPSLNGRTLAQVANSYITGPIQNIGGVYIFIAKQEKKVDLAVGATSTRAIPIQRKEAIRQAILAQFKSGNFDAGLLAGIGMIDDSYRAALPVSRPMAGSRPAYGGAPIRTETRRDSGIGLGTIVLIIIIAYFIISLIRSFGQRAMGGGGYAGGPGGPGPGYSGPGYGGGYGGGGGFFSGLLGGLGGAMVGNWLYDKFSGHEGGGMTYDNSNQATYTQGSSDWTQPSAAGTGWSDDGGATWGSSDTGGFGGSVSDTSSSFGDAGGGFGGSVDAGGGGGGDWS